MTNEPRYPQPKKFVSPAHIIWAYDNYLLVWAEQGLSVAKMQKQLRENNLHVGRDAILSVIGGRRRGDETNKDRS